MGLLNTVDTYQTLQPFTSVEQLNANTKAIRELYADKMTRSTYRVLDELHRWSCKYPGVCYRSKKKIAEDLGLSQRTVIRSCKTLVDLGAIVQHETKRAGGDRRRSTNAIVFVVVAPIEIKTVSTDVSTECHDVDTPLYSPVNTQTLKDTYDTGAPVIHSKIEVVKDSEEQSKFNPNDKEHLKASLPDGWYRKASGYSNNAADLYAITGELFKAKKGTDLRVEDYLEEFGEVLRRSYVSLKSGRIDPSKWHAYLFTAFRKTAHAIVRQERVAPMFNRLQAIFDEPIQQQDKPQYTNVGAGASMDGYLLTLCTH